MVTSVANETIKAVRRLRLRKERDRTGLFFVEGARLVGAAFQAGMRLQQLVVAPDLVRTPFGAEVIRAVRAAGIPGLDVSERVFGTLSPEDDPEGLGAVVAQRWLSVERPPPTGERCWVALDTILYPGNLGTIIRTCDAVGGAGVVLIGPTTDPYHPTAVRTSLGALFTQRLLRANTNQLAAWKQSGGFTVIGTSPSADEDYHAVAYPPPTVLFMGSERRGLSSGHLALCDRLVRIPMAGVGDSLNVAVAAGVVLYEIFNQWRGRAEDDGGMERRREGETEGWKEGYQVDRRAGARRV